MNRVRIFAYAGTGLVLAALAWSLTATPPTVAVAASDMLSRSAGLALLGLAMITVGLAFRTATRIEQKPAARRPQTSEYRRGFGRRPVRAQAKPRQPTQRRVVVSLRRAVAEQGIAPAPAETGTALPVPDIERLQTMLHSRLAQLTSRDADMTSRPFTRRRIDLHDLAPK